MTMKSKIDLIRDISKTRANRCRLLFFRNALLFSFFALLFQACDDCDPIDYSNEEAEIYFTSMPINSQSPIAMGIRSDRSNLYEIAENSILYCGANANDEIFFQQLQPNGKWKVYQSDVFGGSLVELAIAGNPDEISFLVYSDNGDYLASQSTTGNVIKTSILQLGNTQRTLDAVVIEGTLPAFSPDGKHFAFFEMIGSFPHVRVIESINPEQEEYVEAFFFGIHEFGHGLKNSITWSADSKYICFSAKSLEEGYVQLIVQNLENHSDRYEIDMDMEILTPSISPDNESVVFASGGDLWIIDLATEELEKLTNISSDYEQILYPEWSPDSSKILYIKYFSDPTADIYSGNLEIYNLKSGSISVISNNVTTAAWTRNGIK